MIFPVQSLHILVCRALYIEPYIQVPYVEGFMYSALYTGTLYIAGLPRAIVTRGFRVHGSGHPVTR